MFKSQMFKEPNQEISDILTGNSTYLMGTAAENYNL